MIIDLPAGRVPGLKQSPIFAVAERVTAPRYEAVAEAWGKAVSFSTGDDLDPTNAAVAAVESLVKIIAEMPDGTLGDAVKGLSKSGAIRPPLEKVFHKLWGFSSNEGGVRHGGVAVSVVTPADATFIVNMAASGILYLLELDRPASAQGDRPA